VLSLRATYGVSYYTGKAKEMCKPVLAHHQSRIYPDYPSDLMLKCQSSATWRKPSFRESQSDIFETSNMQAGASLSPVSDISGLSIRSDAQVGGFAAIRREPSFRESHS
jgi:hypothetical protein